MSAQNTTSNDHLTSALSKLTSLVDNHFECSICLDTFSDPHVIPECLHRFCGACVKESIRKCGAECPTCRARITTRRGLRKDKDLQDMMSMVLTAVEHLNQAKAEATDSERCAIKTEETGTPGTVNEEGANSSSIQLRVIMPRRSKRVPEGLCATEGDEGNDDQDGGGHNIDNAAVGNNDRHVLGGKDDVQSRKTSDWHNSDNAGVMTNPDSSAGIRTKDIDDSTATEVTRKRNAEDSSSNKKRKKGTAARTESFEGRCKQLIDFIDEFGHCNVSRKYSVDPSLRQWCSSMRYYYNQIQQGHTPKGNLTQDQIERLEEIGFNWKVTVTFEQRCHDLETFKSEFGHCNIPYKYSVDPSLWNWCSKMRYAYNQIQQGQTPGRNLTQDQIARLEEIGFKWKVQETFEQRCHDFETFKSEFGHCNVPSKYSVDPSLGTWCVTMRYYYNQIQQGQTTKNNLTPDRIARLEEIGFKWTLTETFEQRCHALEAFKSEFGHYNVPQRYSADPSLGQWYGKMRSAYNKIQQGQTPERNLTQEQIKRLEEIGFK